MKIPAFTVRHPILTTMIALIVVILGFIAVRRLPLDLMPDISYPVLSISTSYPNSSPAIVEQLITRPVEEAMSAVPGVEEITSTSSEGDSHVELSFAWGTNLETAAADVRDRLDRVVPRLPDDAERPQPVQVRPRHHPGHDPGGLRGRRPRVPAPSSSTSRWPTAWSGWTGWPRWTCSAGSSARSR